MNLYSIIKTKTQRQFWLIMKFRLPSSHPQFWSSYFNWTKIKPRNSRLEYHFHTSENVCFPVWFFIPRKEYSIFLLFVSSFPRKMTGRRSETTEIARRHREGKTICYYYFFFNLSFSYVSLWKDPNIESLLYFLIQVVICRRELDILINDLKRIMSKE